MESRVAGKGLQRQISQLVCEFAMNEPSLVPLTETRDVTMRDRRGCCAFSVKRLGQKRELAGPDAAVAASGADRRQSAD